MTDRHAAAVFSAGYPQLALSICAPSRAADRRQARSKVFAERFAGEARKSICQRSGIERRRKARGLLRVASKGWMGYDLA